MTTYCTRFTVRGRTIFPVDMLRYDSCFPRESQDAAKLAYTPQDIHDAKELSKDGDVKVTLLHIGTNRHWQPTQGRWASFLWSVDPDIETSKIG